MIVRAALDSNLLLLFVVGSVAKDYISQHRRLKSYTASEFDLLIEVISGAEQLVATPNSLTEVSNLLSYGVSEPLLSQLREGLRALLVSGILEKFQPSHIACCEPEFRWLGIADSAWLGCLDAETVFFTDDLDLYVAACSRGGTVYNFTHLREQRGLL
jgi:hypothetical protein